MTPYYQRGGATLYHGDCLDVLPLLSGVDAIITDPPYGIAYQSTHNSHRKGEWSKWVKDENFPSIAGDDKPFDPRPWLAFPVVAMFGGNYFASRLPDSRCWITWDKIRDTKPNDFADCEYIWTNADRPSRIYRHLWRGLIREGEENVARSHKFHPHQKPVALMAWLIDYLQVPSASLVADPYMGSNSTGVAAIRSGRKFIGVEIDERYCEIAAKRIDGVIDSAPLLPVA